MPFHYTFAKAPLKLGDRDEKYGQAWWAEVNEHLQPVKFNTMQEGDILITHKIDAEERTEKQTKKGKDYYQLKKVKVVGQAPLQTAKTGLSQLDRIEQKLDQLLGNDSKLVSQEQVQAQLDAQRDAKKIDKVHEVTDEEIDLSEIPF